MNKWTLIVREPRAGEMFEVIHHGFETPQAAVEHLAGFVHRFCGRDEIKVSLFGEGDVLMGLYCCAWPFFADVLAPEGTSNENIWAALQAVAA